MMSGITFYNMYGMNESKTNNTHTLYGFENVECNDENNGEGESDFRIIRRKSLSNDKSKRLHLFQKGK